MLISGTREDRFKGLEVHLKSEFMCADMKLPYIDPSYNVQV